MKLHIPRSHIIRSTTIVNQLKTSLFYDLWFDLETDIYIYVWRTAGQKTHQIC